MQTDDTFELGTAFETPPVSQAEPKAADSNQTEQTGQGMLVIKVRHGDHIEIGNGVSLMVGKRDGNKFFLSIKAPGAPVSLERDGKMRIGRKTG